MSASEAIVGEVSSRAGVSARPHRLGGVELRHRIDGDDGVGEGIELFRLAYERARLAERVRADRAGR